MPCMSSLVLILFIATVIGKECPDVSLLPTNFTDEYEAYVAPFERQSSTCRITSNYIKCTKPTCIVSCNEHNHCNGMTIDAKQSHSLKISCIGNRINVCGNMNVTSGGKELTEINCEGTWACWIGTFNLAQSESVEFNCHKGGQACYALHINVTESNNVKLNCTSYLETFTACEGVAIYGEFVKETLQVKCGPGGCVGLHLSCPVEGHCILNKSPSYCFSADIYVQNTASTVHLECDLGKYHDYECVYGDNGCDVWVRPCTEISPDGFRNWYPYGHVDNYTITDLKHLQCEDKKSNARYLNYVICGAVVIFVCCLVIVIWYRLKHGFCQSQNNDKKDLMLEDVLPNQIEEQSQDTMKENEGDENYDQMTQ